MRVFRRPPAEGEMEWLHSWAHLQYRHPPFVPPHLWRVVHLRDRRRNPMVEDDEEDF